ncbi:MAG: NAD-dependent epimerase/dehydratase family protein [Saprospiraceae bacterium]|nr:NAD-dependent epimerase/dehydratase family protein [Candidatus Vicinibacter affinis]
MHITVTGATGHIGNNLVRLLCTQGHQVRAAFRTTEKSFVLEGLPVEQIVGDILVPDFCNRICKDTEVVVHTAALISIDGDPHGLVHKTNTIGVANIVNSCLKKDVRKLIHLSSIHAFDLAASGPLVKELSPSATPHGMAYDYSKVRGDEEARRGLVGRIGCLCHTSYSGHWSNDYFNSYSGVFLRKLFTGKLPALIRGGFDWVDVRDVVQGISTIIQLSSNREQTLNARRYIFSGAWASVEEIAEMCAEISDRKKYYPVFSKQVARIGLPFIRGYAALSGNKSTLYPESIDTLLHPPIQISKSKGFRKLIFMPGHWQRH